MAGPAPGRTAVRDSPGLEGDQLYVETAGTKGLSPVTTPFFEYLVPCYAGGGYAPGASCGLTDLRPIE